VPKTGKQMKEKSLVLISSRKSLSSLSKTCLRGFKVNETVISSYRLKSHSKFHTCR